MAQHFSKVARLIESLDLIDFEEYCATLSLVFGLKIDKNKSNC